MVTKMWAALLDRIRRALTGQSHQRPEQRSAAEIFSEIYRRNMWGGKAGTFYSGPGSDAEFARQFSDVANTLIAERGIKSVVDLGCGDFRVGGQIASAEISYTGVDVVDALIERNRQLFARAGIKFCCMDIIEGDLPGGDLCILRQVLQHLSNAQIARILGKLGRYRFALIGEHHPDPTRLKRPNLDRQAGFDTRVEYGSGVFLELPPFSAPGVSVLARFPLPPLMAPGETIAIYLIEQEPRASRNKI
jgi:SAM-dependent methyltransferase